MRAPRSLDDGQAPPSRNENDPSCGLGSFQPRMKQVRQKEGSGAHCHPLPIQPADPANDGQLTQPVPRRARARARDPTECGCASSPRSGRFGGRSMRGGLPHRRHRPRAARSWGNGRRAGEFQGRGVRQWC
jgi:hypothetical protein